jgi:CRISPR-associated protein Cas2
MGKWVIGYDICDPRRLQRVYRTMLKHATPLEYSIFLLVGTERDRACCLSQVAALISQDTDDLRCYPLPERGLQERIGKAALPEGVHWSVLPSTL